MAAMERPLRVDGYGPSANQRGQSRSWHSGVVQKSEGFRWVGRLGRNYADVTEVIRQFMARGVIIRTVINGLTFDGGTKDPMQKAVRDALVAFMAATAEAQAEATREAQRAGIAHARANEPLSYRGRKPTFDRARLDLVFEMLNQQSSPSAISKATGLSRQTVYRIKDNPAKAEGLLVQWSR